MRIHCIPVRDERLHCAQITCWCHPLLDKEPTEGGYVCVHNAKDCREVFERHDEQRSWTEYSHGGWVNIGEELPSLGEKEMWITEGINSVLCCRCMKHKNVGPLNEAIATGGECPVCEIEKRKEELRWTNCRWDGEPSDPTP